MALVHRRTVLRGAGVTMACRGSIPCPRSRRPRRAAFPKRFAVLFMGNGINENHWGAEGSGAEMKLSQSLSPLEPLKQKINVINGLFNKHSTGQGIHPAQTGSLLSGAPFKRGPVIHVGHHRRSDDRQPHRPGHAAAQHRAGVRAADDGLPRDQLLDGVQLAHLVAERRLAGAQRSLPVAGLRQAVREPRQPAQPEHPGSREGRCAEPEPPDQLHRQAEAR